MDYDTRHLARLTTRRERFETELPKVRDAIEDEMRRLIAQGAPQVEVARVAKVTREVVRVACLPAEERAKWKTRRRKPAGGAGVEEGASGT